MGRPFLHEPPERLLVVEFAEIERLVNLRARLADRPEGAVGHEVPPAFYRAVAEVLAYVYQLARKAG